MTKRQFQKIINESVPDFNDPIIQITLDASPSYYLQRAKEDIELFKIEKKDEFLKRAIMFLGLARYYGAKDN